MEHALPHAYAELCQVRETLERHYHDMQDIEFTVQQNKLYMLQTRNGKRTAAASPAHRGGYAEEELITRKEAVMRVNPQALDQLLHPTLDPKAPRTGFGRGLPASPGAASGAVVFSADDAEMRAAKGEAVILVRIETSPEDIHGMHAARGILTTRGGMTSHAAVVARGMGRPCVAGAGGIQVDYGARTLSAGGRIVRGGETITIDGSTGEVFLGTVATVEPSLSGDFVTLMEWRTRCGACGCALMRETAAGCRNRPQIWCRRYRVVPHRTHVLRPGAHRRRTPDDHGAGRARSARGTGKVLPFQRQDFIELFRIMAGLPVTIRLLDPPLHEFLPHGDTEMADVAEALGQDLESMRRRAAELAEANPMLGHRGCRLGISFPEIYEMQARAIFEAALGNRPRNPASRWCRKS